MSVNNTLAKSASNKIVEYECNGETVKISPYIIRNYLVNGNGDVSEQEVVMFLNLCRYQHLNPFLREAYLIKYGAQPATIVTGKDVFTKRAKRNKDYRGNKAGIIIQKKDGSVDKRSGTFKLAEETLVGGWAEVYINGFAAPIEMTVSLDEYIGRKKDGEVNSQWSNKPATMIRKVALVQALREAFPEDFQGMYSSEETGVDELPPISADETTIIQQEEQPAPQDDGNQDFFDEV